ncbi:MAG: peptide MFS transporter [Planctomycetes bacterium]|nr:peptide MFS transporter [Planctomycetota bacterium]
MWERFSYYGMRALLVLYLISGTSAISKDGQENANPGFGWTGAEASELYGIYQAAVYVTPLLGGWLADRFLGTHRSMLIGGWIIAAGHITLACTEFFGITAGKAVTMQTGPGAFLCFMAGLVLIVIGTGFFKPCVSVMVGQLYERDDPRRDSGFTIFYMGINLGAFLSPLVAGTLGEEIGWHWGFGSAAVGMLAGLFFYQIFRPKYLGDIGLPPGRESATAARRTVSDKSARESLTSVDVQRLVVIVVLAFLGNIFFWSAFEQAGSSMNIFALEETDRTAWGLFADGGLLGGVFKDATFPASWYQSVNPFAILLFAPVFSWLWVWLDRRGANPSTPLKFAIGLYLLGLAFLAMVVGAMRARGPDLAGPHWLLIAYVVVTWGELCLSPVGLSMVTKLSPPQLQSLMMGFWFLSMAVSNYFAGQLAAFSTKMDTSRHVVEFKEDAVYAEVRYDARQRRLSLQFVRSDRETPLPIATQTPRFDATFADGERVIGKRSITLTPKEDAGDEGVSEFIASSEAVPAEVDDIEDISGTLKVEVDGEPLSATLVHEHYMFVFEGLAGFYFLLVVVPIGAGIVLTVLTPLLKRMMHNVQ